MSALPKLSRRDFIKATATTGAGLVVGFYLPAPGNASAAAHLETESFAPNAFLKIERSGKVTIWFAKSEMGQGVRTALPVLIAEELEADWADVTLVQADLDRKYGNQGTGGSSSVRTGWKNLRTAGATAREMLLIAAAEKWGVEKSACRAEKGQIIHTPTGRKLRYGELVEAASKVPVPKDVPLKDPKDFRLIGKRFARSDSPEKIDGSGVFGIDVKVSGMLYAVVARCPVFRGKVASFDSTKAKAVGGVRDVVQISSGVAVIASSTWAAMRGREALEIKWDEGEAAGENSASLRQSMLELAQQSGKTLRNNGDAMATIGSAVKKIDAVYELPYLAHATMEPMNCTADVRKEGCEIWAPTQFPDWAAGEAARITGLPQQSVKVHVTFLGGGFGRRAMPDFAIEAVQVSKAAGAPVKVVWTREDDMRHDFYRPASYHRLSAGVDAQGSPVAWSHHLISTSIQASMNPAGTTPEGSEIGGAIDLPYRIPNILVAYSLAKSAVPRGWWRSVEHSFNAFVVESFLDEIAAASGKDPYRFRLQLLGEPRRLEIPEVRATVDIGRLRGVLDLAATKAGWGRPLPKGSGRGIAAHFSFGSYIAHVAEVSVAKDGGVRVHRVVSAVDCGTVVNPDSVEAQIQSAIVYGLSAALKGAITIEKGRVTQSNFHDYEVLRINETPRVEVHIVPSAEPPGGMGEPGLPPIAPAVTNAIFAATGKRIRRLPIQQQDLKS